MADRLPKTVARLHANTRKSKHQFYLDIRYNLQLKGQGTEETGRRPEATYEDSPTPMANIISRHPKVCSGTK